MYQYPNYYPTNNPYGQQIQQQYYNPYAVQQSQTTNMVKFVDSIESVKVTDVPMDGNMYYFPKADGTEIYTKQWLSNGKTRILTFKPDLEVGQINPSESNKNQNMELTDGLNGILKRLDNLSDRFDSLEKSIRPTRRGKEVQNESVV